MRRDPFAALADAISLKHEPECPEAFTYKRGICIYCNRIRAAYQRGREDAAQAVGQPNLYAFDDNVFGPLILRDMAIAAARGEGK